jgi:ATP-dependent RNA helicase HelY
LGFDPDDAGQLIAAFKARYPFPLDHFQEEAIAQLARGESVMVAAPTGTGKTVVAEFGVFRAWARGWRVMYTTPIKALSNQKFRDLREQYGNAVGLLTGDIIENREGSILIMTTEVLRNML